jgi:hypothetical protein
VVVDLLPTEGGTEKTDLTVAVDLLPTEGGTEITEAGAKAVVKEASKVKVIKKEASKITNSKEVEAARSLALSLEEVLLISN